MIVIDNGAVLTMDDARTVHFGGHVVIDGDRITAVGADNRQPDASARAAALVNCGVSTLALRLRMCFRHVLHRPLSSSKIACVSASEGGLISDTGFMYPVATLRGAWPWLIKPSHVDTV